MMQRDRSVGPDQGEPHCSAAVQLCGDAFVPSCSHAIVHVALPLDRYIDSVTGGSAVLPNQGGRRPALGCAESSEMEVGK